MKAGFSIKLLIIFCAELSATNCRAELSNAELSAPNCPRRIVRAELSCAELSGHLVGIGVVSSNQSIHSINHHHQVKSSLRLFRPPLTQTQRGLENHKKKFTKQNKSVDR